MENTFQFTIFHPQGLLAAYIQGIWAGTVTSCTSSSLKRWLASDAGSGIIFILQGSIKINDKNFSSGAVLLPVSTQAHSVTLAAGTQIAGIRFNPASGGVDNSQWQGLVTQLKVVQGHYARITTLYRELINQHCHFRTIPERLKQGLSLIQQQSSVNVVCDELDITQRQIERLFKTWVGMTPKYYQRLMRVKTTMGLLKQNPQLKLAALALELGFADQAHMTRECKEIALITPKLYATALIKRQHSSRLMAVN
ncbi:helix-turn-helix domain-containing protein [Alteromonadaceae bacterium BrNp21-10]|nr:helix-turn-helix domain-containing protein [Alteromonadaceae bacterium BrNp21-10]